jgi:S1-C subfamily serine protease
VAHQYVGVFVLHFDGYIINNHVIKDASENYSKQTILQAKLIGTDSKMDIALLKVMLNTPIPPLGILIL